MRISQCLCVCGVTVALGCGGVSEERMSSVEQQVKKLQETPNAPAQADASTPALATKVEALDAATNERFKKLEDMMELLQKAVAESGTTKPSAGPTSNVWADVDTALGIEQVGVEANGDNYTVKRSWLARELQAAALSGKGPKLTPAKPAGLTVRLIKPKSFIDRLGFKNGDVLIAVGDVAVSSVEELSVALQKLRSPASLKIQRKKKEVVLQYTLRD